VTPCRSIAQDRERARDVVRVVAQRLRDRLADGLQRGEVQDRVDRLGRERRVERGSSRMSAMWKSKERPATLRDPLDDVGVAVREVVEPTTSCPAARSSTMTWLAT
jgi:hypothetical protein